MQSAQSASSVNGAGGASNAAKSPDYVYFDRTTAGFSDDAVPRAKGAQLKLEHYYKVAVDAAIEQTRGFLRVMIREVGAVHHGGGTLKEAFERTRAALAPRYGKWPIFEHCLPFDVSRLWDELSGIERPVIWTAERDREVWDLLQD